MAEPAERIDPVSLEEFQAMHFGDRRAELIDGVIVVAQEFPTARHGAIAAALGANLYNAIRGGRLPCRVEVGTGIEIRQDRDWNLGPDVTVRCGGTCREPGQPTLVAEILSPSNRATELMRKLHAYQSVPSLTDILLIEQDAYRVEHWTRTERGSWTLAEPLSGPDAVLSLPRLGRAWRLEELYGDL